MFESNIVNTSNNNDNNNNDNKQQPSEFQLTSTIHVGSSNDNDNNKNDNNNENKEQKMNDNVLRVSSNEETKMNACSLFKWYFTPIFGDLKYSMKALLYQILNGAITLSTFIIMVVMLALSIPSLIFIVGIPFHYLVSELSLLLARIDLRIAYYMLEDNLFLLKKPKSLMLTMDTKLPPCPSCNSCFPCCHIAHKNDNTDDENNSANNTHCCSILFQRLKIIFTSCAMYLVFLYQIIIKPVATVLTIWTCQVVFYALYTLLTPITYLIDEKSYQNEKMCAFGGSSCNDQNECVCYGLKVKNFGFAVMVFMIGVVALPLAFRLNNIFAKFSKTVTYFCLTQYYYLKDNSGNSNSGNRSNDNTILLDTNDTV